METLLGKIKVIQNWCFRYYEEILESLSEIISVKLRKNHKEIPEKFWKNTENKAHKKTILMET